MATAAEAVTKLPYEAASNTWADAVQTMLGAVRPAERTVAES